MKVLVAEDNPVESQMLENMLKRLGYDVAVAYDGTEALELLQAERGPRLALLDWLMPGLDGLEVCRRIRAGSAAHYVYVIMVTMRRSKEDFLEAMEAGVDEYLRKPVDVQELAARLRIAQRILQLQHDLAASREPSLNPITGAWSRQRILDILERDLARARAEKTPISVVKVSLEDFKRLRDEIGPTAADALFREIGQRLRFCLRPYDAYGRYGIAEALAVLPGSDEAKAREIAEQIRTAITKDPIAIPQGQYSLTPVVGVATVRAEEATDVESIIRAADEASVAEKGPVVNRGLRERSPARPDRPKRKRPPGRNRHRSTEAPRAA